jgi:hypothetical protein
MVAKRFFYICAGILCLALAYQLGAVTALGQGGNTLIAAALPAGGAGSPVLYGLASNGALYNKVICCDTWRYSGMTFPISGRVVDFEVDPGTAINPNPTYYVFTEEGNVFACTALSGCSQENVFTGPTPATHETWGEIKSKYREGAKAQDK